MAQPREPKDWKYLLQQTGLPLEQSVNKVLAQHGVGNVRELRFERTDEQGKTVVSSVDLAGDMALGPFDISVLVECKYRRDDVQWLFAPATATIPWDIPKRSAVMNVFPQLHRDIKLEEDYLSRTMSIPLVAKGVEMKGSDSMDAPIRKALFQLRFGMQRLFQTYLEGVVHELTEDRVPAFVPIIVTTAELWRLRDDVGVEEVRTAEDFTQVATKADVLVIRDSPDPLVEREARLRLEGAFDENARDIINDRYGGKLRIGFKSMAFHMCRSPRFFYVMSYEHFNKSFTSLKTFYEQFPHQLAAVPREG